MMSLTSLQFHNHLIIRIINDIININFIVVKDDIATTVFYILI